MKNLRLWTSLWIFVGIIYVGMGGSVLYAGVLTIEPHNSTVLFKMQNISGYTQGAFTQLRGNFELSDDHSKLLNISVEVELKSLWTHQSQRDHDLHGADFFDTIQFPTAKFVSKKIEAGKIFGDLTIKGKTKTASFDYVLGLLSTKEFSIIAKGTIDRKDFGITYNPKLEGGKFLLGDFVEISAELRGVNP